MLLLILLRLAMSENQRRLTRTRFFEVPLNNIAAKVAVVSGYDIE